ncbi:MAG: sialidase family protein [Armatimonadota bacterium]|nr:sialidase family protein [Armatimonadota bacterium]
MSDRIKWLREIYEDGRHNAFTDIRLFRGRYYVCFRSGTAHGSLDGQTRVMASADLKSWQQVALLSTVLDDRDPKLAEWGGRLWVLGPTRTPDFPEEMTRGARRFRFQSVGCSTTDGEHWSPGTVLEPIDHRFWRPREHAGAMWVANHCSNPEPGREEHASLWRSTDMQRWEFVSMIHEGERANETDIEFLDDGTLVAFVRREEAGGAGTPFKTSAPPYTQWEQHDQPLDVRGPMLTQAEGTLYVCGRLMEPTEEGTLRDTRLYRVTDDFQLEELLVLPAPDWAPERQGDNSYAGAHYVGGDELLLSYYSGTGHRAGIYVASIDIS